MEWADRSDEFIQIKAKARLVGSQGKARDGEQAHLDLIRQCHEGDADIGKMLPIKHPGSYLSKPRVGCVQCASWGDGVINLGR